MINKQRLIHLLGELIAIDSQNPPGNEAKIAAYLAGRLCKAGFKPRLKTYKKNRPNVLCVLPGRSRAKELLISPHLDTVPAGRGWKTPPLKPVIKSGRIYGLGATDCKCNLACSVEVMLSLAEDGHKLDYDLTLAATADEESGSAEGLIPLLNDRTLKPDAALVIDADNFDIVVAQKGLFHLKVKLQGKRAHGAYPQRGRNAIDDAAAVLNELKEHTGWFYRKHFSPGKSPYLLPPTLNTGTIRGGDKVNIVADWCEMELDWRFLPENSWQLFLSDLKKLISGHALKYSVEIEGVQKPYSISVEHPLVTGLCRAMEKNRIKPRLCGSEGATTITFFQEKKIPAVATGFGRTGCEHSPNEFAGVADVFRGAVILEEFLKDYKF